MESYFTKLESLKTTCLAIDQKGNLWQWGNDLREQNEEEVK